MSSLLQWKGEDVNCVVVACEVGELLVMMCVNAILFDSRTNLRGGGGVCNELWLWFITVLSSDELLCGREVRGRDGGERIAHSGDFSRDYFIDLKYLDLVVSSSSHPPSRLSVMLPSFFVTIHDYDHDCAWSLQSTTPTWD